MKNLNPIKTCLVLLLVYSFCNTQLHAQNQSPDTIISAGIIVVDSASLRKEPDINSDVIKKLDFGTPFFILEKQQFLEEKEHRWWYWYKTILTDKKTIGWITGKEGREGSRERSDSAIEYAKKGDFANLYYAVACQAFWGYREYDAAEKLFLYILKQYPDKQLQESSEICDKPLYFIGKLGALENLAKLYRERKEYQKSIKYYEKITRQKEAKKENIISARRDIMHIYKEDIQDAEKTIELCHSIIKDFPNGELRGYEWNIWVDIEAASSILNICYQNLKDTDRRMKESRKILSETSNPPVILIATQGIITAQINKGDDEIAQKTLLEIMKKYPKEIRTYFMSHVDFTLNPFADAIEALVTDMGNYDKAIELIKIVRDSIREEEVSNFAAYKTAQLLDEGDGSIEEVLSACEKIPSCSFWDPAVRSLRKRELSSGDMKKRAEYIKTYKPEKTVVSSENTVIKQGLKSNKFDSLQKGTRATILYKDTSITTLNGKDGIWAKVKLENGKIGWVFDACLSLVGEKPIFPPLTKNVPVWEMEGANTNRTSYINSKPIKTPEIVKIFPNMWNIHIREGGGVIFSDLNEDKILDILTYSSGRLVTIDGKTQKVMWHFDCGGSSIPAVKDNVVYLISLVEYKESPSYTGGEYRLYALDKKTGTLDWELLVNKNRIMGFSPASPVVSDNFVYVGTFDGKLLAIDIKERKVKWEFSVFEPIKEITKINNLIYFAAQKHYEDNDKLFAIDASDGQLIWEFDFQSKTDVSGICAENKTLFCKDANGIVYALDAKTGHLLWKKELLEKRNSGLSNPSLHNGIIYIASDKTIYAINSKNGNIKWEYAYQHSLWGTPAVVNGALYIRSIDSYLHAISLSNGKLLWQFKIPGEEYGGILTPTVEQGLIFIGSLDNNLYVIGEKNN